MIKTAKELKKLTKSYTKKLNAIHKNNLKLTSYPLDYFINYLYFIRDSLILTEPLEIAGEENLKISSLATALEEFNLYRFCETKYFKFEKGQIHKVIEGSTEELLKNYNSEKAAHWNNFWQLVATNIEYWLGDLNVTI